MALGVPSEALLWCPVWAPLLVADLRGKLQNRSNPMHYAAAFVGKRGVTELIFPGFSSLCGSAGELAKGKFFQETWTVRVKEPPLPFEGCGVRCGARLRDDWLSLFSALSLPLLPDYWPC